MDIRRDETRNAIRERVGSIVGSAGPVPMALWTPEGVVADFVVLVGHGAGANKHEEYVVALARRLVRDFSMAVCAIDGPVHGERRDDGETGVALQFLEFGQRWSNDPGLTDEMVADWRATIDELFNAGIVSSSAAVGYWGLSMGSIFGLPLVAAEPRIKAAVLGLLGISGPTKERIAQDAARINVPVMFVMQWDDEIFARDKVLALYDAISTRDKILIATPGAHAAVTPETFRRSADFLGDRLGAEKAPK